MVFFLLILLFPCLVKTILAPTISDITNDRSHFADSDSSSALSKDRNVTALSTGGTKLLIYGYGFSENSTLGNKVLIGSSLECQVVTYYTTSSQIQCIVPSYETINVPLNISVIVDGVNAKFGGDYTIKLVYIYDPSLVVRVRPFNVPQITPTLSLELYSTVNTDKGQIYLINIGEYVCTQTNPSQKLEKDKANVVVCSLPSNLVSGYFPLQFLIKNGGGLLINANSCKNILMRENSREYQVSFHPTILRISSNNGSSLGNFLEVWGNGFSASLSATYQGKSLIIEKRVNSSYMLIRIPQIQEALPVSELYAGGIGFQELIYYKAYAFNQTEDLLNKITPNSISMNLSLNPKPYLGKKPYTRLLRGFFKPAVSSDYRFFCSGVEKVRLLISNITASAKRQNLNLACQNLEPTLEDDYFIMDGQVSSWFSLITDQLYYMELMQINSASDNDQLKVGVEIQKNQSEPIFLNTPDFAHPHDVQIYNFSAKFVPESLLMALYNIDTFRSAIYIKVGGTSSPKIDITTSSDAISKALEPFFGANATITLSFSALNGSKVADHSKAVNCEVRMDFNDKNRVNYSMIPVLDNSSIVIYDASKTSNWTVVRLQIPSDPLSGTYRIGLNSSQTSVFNLTTSADQISAIMKETLPGLNLPVISTVLANTSESLVVSIEFRGNPGAMALMEINKTMLRGGPPGERPNVTVYRTKEGNDNIFINPITEEFLRVANPNPEILLMSNNTPSVCLTNCQYSFLPNSSLPFVSSAALINDTLICFYIENLTKITGFSSEKLGIMIGENQKCPSNGLVFSNDTVNTGWLNCSFSYDQYYAGNFTPNVILSPFGILPNLSPNIIIIHIPLAILSVSPSAGSLYGGALLNISGTGFPLSSADAGVSVTAGTIPCENPTVSSNLITCRISTAYPQSGDLVASISVSVTTSNQTIQNQTYSFGSASTPYITSVNKEVVCPWRATTLEIALDVVDSNSTSNSYSVYLLDSSKNRTNCTGVTLFPTNKTLKCILIGKGSIGSFSLKVLIDSRGLAGYMPRGSGLSQGTSVYVGCKVNRIDPTSGSLYGGTLVSVYGNGFGMGIEAKFGTYACLVNQSSANETFFQCEIEKLSLNTTTSTTLGLYYLNQLMNSEIATFNFTSAKSLQFDTNTDSLFKKNRSSSDSLEFKSSPSMSAYSAARVTFWLANNSSFSPINLNLLTDKEKTITVQIPPLSPQVYTVSINYLSYGFGSLTLTTMTIETSCGKPTPTEAGPYGNILTFTLSSPSDSYWLTMKAENGTYYNITYPPKTSNTNVTFLLPHLLPSEDETVQFYLMDATSGNQLCNIGEFKSKKDRGKDMQLDNVLNQENGAYDFCYCLSFSPSTDPNDHLLIHWETGEYLRASSCYQTSPTECATFQILQAKPGIYYPVVYDTNKGFYNTILQTTSVPSSITLKPEVSNVKFNSSSSYGGGNIINITGQHFYLQPRIEICEKNCKIFTTQTDLIQCEIPEYRTLAMLSSHSDLLDCYDDLTSNATLFSDLNSTADQEKIRDHNDSTYYRSLGSATCYIGFDFGKKIRVVIVKIGISLANNQWNTLKYLNTSFEASTDGSNWTTLFYLSNLVDGMNYIDLTLVTNVSQLASYRYVRFNDRYSGTSCQIREIKIFGIIVAFDWQMSSCDLKLFFDDSGNQTSDYLSEYSGAKTVNFSENYTQYLSYVSPVFYVPSQTAYPVNMTFEFNENSKGNYQIYLLGQKFQALSSSNKTMIFSLNLTIAQIGNQTFGLIMAKNEYGWVVMTRPLINYIYFAERWSVQTTWNDNLPIAGSSILIPSSKAVLLDKSPEPLKMLIIEGILVASDEIDMTLTAEKIVIRNNGSLVVGQYNYLYNHNFKVVLSQLSNSSDDSLEDEVTRQYFSKVLSVHGGFLALRGRWRNRRFCKLAESAFKGATIIKLSTDCNIKWFANDSLQITGSESNIEQVTLLQEVNINFPNISMNISIKEALKNDHLCRFSPKSNTTLCPEVADMTSNIVVSGDSSQINPGKSGGYVIIDGFGGALNSVNLRQVLFMDMGQASNLGASPLFFREVRTLLASEIQINAFLRCYNKAVVLQSSRNIVISNNVFFEVYGQAISTVHGTEINNYFTQNLIILVKGSLSSGTWSDFYLAGIFLSNPFNYLSSNIIVATGNIGIYLYFDGAPDGVVSDSICPIYSMTKGILNNEVHDSSYHAFQLDSIYLGWSPKSFSCYQNSALNVDVPVIISGFKAWNVGGHGMYFDRIGSVQIQNSLFMDCKLGGVLIMMVDRNATLTAKFQDMTQTMLNVPLITNCEFSSNCSTGDCGSSQAGIFLPPSEGLVLQNLSFNGFRNGGAISVCQNCDYNGNDPGQHIRVFNISIENCTKIFDFSSRSRNTMILDINGSLSQKSETKIIIARTPHLAHPQACEDSNVTALDVTTIICPVSQLKGLIDCSLFNITKNSDPSKLSLLIMNLGPDPSVLQKSSSKTRISNTTQVSFQQLQNINGFKNPQWRFFLFSGFSYDLELSPKTSFSSINLICTGMTEKYDNIYVKLHYNDAKGLTMVQSSTDNKITTELREISKYSSGGYYYYNNLDRKITYLWLMNALFASNSYLTFSKRACDGGSCCDSKWECDVRLWSDSSTWSSSGQKTPYKGSSITIPQTYRVLLDVVPDSLDQIIVKGVLIFDEMLDDLKLSFNLLFIQSGILQIGTASKAYPSIARLMLVGDRSSTYLDLGNGRRVQKSLVVAGKLLIYGEYRDSVNYALQESIAKGQSSFKFNGNLPWNNGDEFIIESKESANCTQALKIVSIPEGGNTITLNATLNCDHFGNVSKSFIDGKESGLDLRSQVVLVSRNVRIGTGDQVLLDNGYYWGGSLMLISFNGSKGQVVMNNVLLAGLGKSRFDPNQGPASVFESVLSLSSISNAQICNSSFIYGYGSGIELISSDTIIIQSNLFFLMTQYAITVKNGNNLSISDNLIVGRMFEWSPTSGIITSYSVGVYFVIDLTGNYSLQVLRNRVNSFEVGFSIPSSHCNRSTVTFSENSAVGNSIKGFIFFHVNSTCALITSLVAYKNKEGVYSFSKTKKLWVTNLILASNTVGLNLNKGTTDEHTLTVISQLVIVGQSPGSQCLNLTGIQLPVTIEKVKDYPPDFRTMNNWDLIDYYTNFDDKTVITDLKLLNFSKISGSCPSPYLFKTNPNAADFTSPVLLKSLTKFSSSDFTACYFDKPNPDWNTPKYCGDSQCTGLYNVLINDLDGSLMGSKGSLLPSEGNSQFIRNFRCQELAENSLFCENVSLSILLLDSLDSDKLTRSLAPLTLENQLLNMNKSLNSFMDHFYNMYSIYSFRLNRFPGIITLNSTYNLSFAQAAAVKTRIKLSSAKPPDFLHLRLIYAKNQAKKLIELRHFSNNSLIPSIMTVNRTGSLLDPVCGQNFLDPGLQFVEFVVTGEEDCELLVCITNSVILEIRIDQEFADFLGNLSNFSEKLANFLNITGSRLRSINLSPGSSILSFGIAGNSADGSQVAIAKEKDELLGLMKKFKEGIVSGSLDFGSPVLGVNYTTAIQSNGLLSSGSDNVENESGPINLQPESPIIVNNTNATNNTNNESSSVNSSNNTEDNKTTENNSTTTQFKNSPPVIPSVSNTTNKTTTTENNPATQSGTETDNFKIGVIVAVCIAITIFLMIFFVCWRRWRKTRRNSRNYSDKDLEIVGKYYVKNNY